MDQPTATPRADRGLLLIADISGYTGFLDKVAIEHPDMVEPGGPVPPAYVVMSSLLDVIVDRLAPTFELADIEGDAVFGFALDRRSPATDAAQVFAVLRAAYGGFRDRIDEAMTVLRHECNACFLLPSLELKVVVHHGSFVRQPVAGRTKLLGQSVNVTHRLLKNSIVDRLGLVAYVFVTDAAAARLGIPDGVGLDHEERYSDVGAARGRVYELSRESPAD